MNQPIILYGIPNCDIIKKAGDWLRANSVDFKLHNYRTEGVNAKTLKRWCEQVGWEKLLNKRSATWKELPVEIQASAISEEAAVRIMEQYPIVIKRPVVEYEGRVLAVGFDANAYREMLDRKK